MVVLLIESPSGTEHLVINLRAGTRQDVRLADGRTLATDGLAVRVADGEPLLLAGGTFASLGGSSVRLNRVAGTIGSALAGGIFVASGSAPDPAALAGRALIVRHGDGTARAWTIARVENLPGPSVWFHVREQTGFHIDPQTGEAQYDQFPGTRHPGPHAFTVSRLARGTGSGIPGGEE
jgi:hypothetical protein